MGWASAAGMQRGMRRMIGLQDMRADKKGGWACETHDAEVEVECHAGQLVIHDTRG